MWRPWRNRLLEKLCRELGEKKEFLGNEYFAFPTAKKMVEKDLSFYQSIGLGYRAKYIKNLAESLNNGLTGKWVITPEYEDATVCKDYAVVKVKVDFDKQMDYSGRVLNKYQFDDVVLLWYGYQSDFTLDDKKATSYCKYTIDGRCGLMDVKGTILTEPIYTDIVAIEKELFLATLLDDNSNVVLNGKGEVINR